MESIEKVAETVEAAIQAGLRDLRCGPDDVMVEVLEEPSRGIFGIGARPARVRLIFIGRRPEPPKEEAKPSPKPEARPAVPKASPAPQAQTAAEGDATNESEATSEESAERRNRRRRGGRGRNRNERAERGNERRPRERSGAPMADFDYDDDDFSAVPSAAIVPDEEADEDARVGKQVLIEVLNKMGYAEVSVSLHRAESTRQGEELHWVLNIMGKDVQQLTGRRGDTLASLQYLLRLMLSRQLQRRVNIIVDVAEYKLHRAERLQQLATRMADQAVKQGRTVTLEPMPPHERRIVHLTLRERQDVETKSIGEGNARKVTISPVR